MLSERAKSKAEGVGSATAINVVCGDSRITFQCALPIVPRPMMPIRKAISNFPFTCLRDRLFGERGGLFVVNHAKELGLKCAVFP